MSNAAVSNDQYPGRACVRGWHALNWLALALFLVVLRMVWLWRLGGWSALWQCGMLALGANRNNTDLNTWYDRYRPGARLLRLFRQRRWPAEAPRFEFFVILKDCTPESLDRQLESIARQTYANWSVSCVPSVFQSPEVALVATQWIERDDRIRFSAPSERSPDGSNGPAPCGSLRGDYVVPLEAGVSLEPQALHRFAEAALSARPDLIYGDEVITSDNARDVLRLVARGLLSQNGAPSTGIEGLAAIRRTQLDHADIALASVEGAFTLDQLLQNALGTARRVTHVPDIVAQRCPQSERKRAPVAESASLRQLEVSCEPQRLVSRQSARVAIIIPTHNGASLLKRCLASLETTVPSDLTDIFVLDHASDEPETREYLQCIAERHTVVRLEGPFNFSRLMNAGVAAAKKQYDYYLFLNDDVEAIESGWLEHMLSLAEQPGVGIVGATLLYPDRRVQHAGIVLGLTGTCGHVFAGMEYDAKNFKTHHAAAELRRSREVSAVTAACLLIKAGVFSQIAGFDERLEVVYGDVDLCLRARAAGYRVLIDAKAVLQHDESMTRGKGLWDPHPGDAQRFLRRYHRDIIAGDPFYNPLLSRVFKSGMPNPGARCRATIEPRTVEWSHAAIAETA